MLTFLDRIENADPNSPDISDDDKNTSWGHYQFTASTLTCSSVLSSWNSVGNASVACRLIAAAIKTCRVARLLCQSNRITTSSYLSDIYLANIIELLWGLCKDMVTVVETVRHRVQWTYKTFTDTQQSSNAGHENEVGPGTAKAGSATLTHSKPVDEDTAPNSQDPDSHPDSRLSSSLRTGSDANACTREKLMGLTKDELKEVMKAHNLTVTGRTKGGKNLFSRTVLESH